MSYFVQKVSSDCLFCTQDYLFITSLLLVQLTKSEDVSANCHCRCEQLRIPYYRFSPHLDETVDTAETNSEVLCNLIVKAKMLLQNYDAKVNEIILNFRDSAVQED